MLVLKFYLDLVKTWERHEDATVVAIGHGKALNKCPFTQKLPKLSVNPFLGHQDLFEIL